MNEYFDELYQKYKINNTGESLILYKNLFADVELVKGSEQYDFVRNGFNDIISSITVKYGDSQDKELDVMFHIIKNIFDNGYHLGAYTGALFFWYNNEYYVLHGLDIDELDEESMEFRVSVFGDEKIRQILDIQAREYSYIPVLPDTLFKFNIEPDYTALYTRFAPGCQEDFITLCINLIQREKENAAPSARSKAER